MRWQDDQATVVAYKFKHTLNVGFARLGMKCHLKAEVAQLGVHVLGIR